MSYAQTAEEHLQESINSQLEKLDLSAIENYISSLPNIGDGLYKGSFLENIKEIINGSKQLDFNSFFSYIIKIFVIFISFFKTVVF